MRPAIRPSLLLFTATLLAGCNRTDPPPPPPPPVGASGIAGTCLLASEPADEGGKVPARKPWAGAEITAVRVNGTLADDKTGVRVRVDAAGKFSLSLPPADYAVGVNDPAVLAGKSHRWVFLKVQAGQFTTVVIDYDQLHVRDLGKP